MPLPPTKKKKKKKKKNRTETNKLPVDKFRLRPQASVAMALLAVVGLLLLRPSIPEGERATKRRGKISA